MACCCEKSCEAHSNHCCVACPASGIPCRVVALINSLVRVKTPRSPQQRKGGGGGAVSLCTYDCVLVRMWNLSRSLSVRLACCAPSSAELPGSVVLRCWRICLRACIRSSTDAWRRRFQSSRRDLRRPSTFSGLASWAASPSALKLGNSEESRDSSCGRRSRRLGRHS